jgi:hypothetical protein
VGGAVSAQPDYSAQGYNVTSQHGEDGILEAIFARLEVAPGSCIEFGAWDGKKNSNTRNLIVRHGWSGVQIESDTARFAELFETYRHLPRVTCLNYAVGFDSPDTLEEILAAERCPLDFDLLSIDVDGCDYWILASLKRHPKVIVIEFNPSIPNDVDFVQARDLTVHHGSSLKAIDGLARSGGYALIATTVTNAIFARWDLAATLGVTDHSLDRLHPDTSLQTHVIQLYDGTVRLVGVDRLIWRRDIVEITVPQPLPEESRRFEP